MSTQLDPARFAREDLVAVATAQPGRCSLCGGPADSARCVSCVGVLGTTHLFDVPVGIVTLAPEYGAVARAARAYKESLDPATRDLAARRLASLSQQFIGSHESCLAREVGRESFDVVVPMAHSSRRATGQPLAWMLAETRWAGPRLQMALSCRNIVTPHPLVDPTRFAVNSSLVRGRSVLLVDDLWVTGTNVMSAALAIQNAGADSVVVLALARLVPEGTKGSRFNPRECSRCAAVELSNVTHRAS